MRKVFEFDEEKVKTNVLVSVINEVRHMRRRKGNLKFVKILNNVPFEETKIFREINEINGKQFDFVYFMSIFTRNDTTFIINKSIELEQIGDPERLNENIAEICYFIWRIRKVGDKIELMAEGEINYQNSNVKKPQ